MAKSGPKYSFETMDAVLSDIRQKKGLEAPTKKQGINASKSVLPQSNINSVLSYGGGDPKKALRIAEYDVPMESVYERLNDGSYTSKFENYLGAEGNENRLALQQSGWEQAGKGLLKNAIKIGSYATDSVIGTAYGLTKALTSGNLRDLYDNELTNKLDDMNKQLDYALPNYYSDEQKSMSWLRQMGTANFWANDFAGGLAFVGGALLPQVAIGLMTGGASTPGLAVSLGKAGAKLGFKAAKEVGEEAAKAALKKGLKSTLDDGLKAMGSVSQKIGNATGYTKGKDVIKSFQKGILGDKLGTFTNTTGFLARSAGFEAGMEARQAMKESVDNYYQQFQQQNGRMPNFEESQAFMNDAVKSSNKVFGANMAILSLSNAVMFGKKILPESTSNWINKTIGGKVNNIIGLGTKSGVVDGKLTYTMLGANRAQKLAGKAYKTFSKPLVEGVYEEGLQGVASKTMKNYLDAKYDKNNLDGYSFWSSLNDSFVEQYGTNEGWKEMTVGMLIGFAGGAMTPGALKNGYAFSGFGKNSYTSRRSEIESNIKRANDGIELLSNLNRTSAAVAKEASMNSGNQSDFVGAEDTLSHYNFIRSQESINSPSQMKNDFGVVIDNLQLEDESITALERAGLDVDSYKTKLKNDFSNSLSNYEFAKSAVSSLNLNQRLKDTPGNIAEISDALMFGIMAGKDSFENARNIGSQIDSIIGTEGVFNHLDFYNNLEQQEKDQFLELRDKQENLKQLQDASAKIAQKIGKINSTGQMTPELIESRRKTLSEQAVRIQDNITSTQQRIDQIKDALSTNFENSKYNLTSKEMDSFKTVEDVISAVENIDKIDNLIQSFDKSGKRQEADTLRYLVKQFKLSSDAHREMINTHRKMMDTNFFSSKEGKGFLNSILGNKFTMSDDFKKLIQENDAVIDNSLGLNGIRDYDTVQSKLEQAIANNDQLSDREKFRLESLIRLNLSKDAYEKAVEDLQTTSKNMQTMMSPEGKSLATRPEDLRRVNLTAEGLNNINLIDNAINEITKELDYIINYSTKNADKIKGLEKELENLRQQREDIIENNKNKQNAPETTTTTTSDIEAKKADIERRRQEELDNLGQKQLTSGFNKLTEAKAPEQALIAIKEIEQNVNQGAKLSSEQSKQLSDAKEQLKNDGYEIIESPTYRQGEKKIVQSDKEYKGEVLTEQQVKEIENLINSREERGLEVDVEDLPSPVTRVVKPHLYKDGKLIQPAEVNIIKFDSVEQAKNAIKKSKEAGYKQSKASDKINAKYDAELAALEGNTTTTATEDIEAEQAPAVNTESSDIVDSIIENKDAIDKMIEDRLAKYGLPIYDVLSSLTESLERVIWRAKDGKPVDTVTLTEAIDTLYNIYKDLSRLKNSENNQERLNKSLTLEYITAAQKEIEQELNYLIDYETSLRTGEVIPTFEYTSKTTATTIETSTEAGTSTRNDAESQAAEQAVEDKNSKRTKTPLTESEELNKQIESVQQNAPFSAPEQTVSTEQEEIEKKISDLEKQLDELKRPFKIIESPEYIRYYELASRNEKENLTEAEKQELEELRTDIDQWTMITGVVVDGFRLSDLLLQKSVLENTVIEKSKDIEIPTSEDTLDDETFADVTTRANYSFGLVYDKVFASKSGDLITLHNINAKSLEDILGKEFMDANGIVLEEDKTGKENVVLSQASIDVINEKSNIRIRKSERNMLTNYSVVLERIVGLDGNVTYKPLNSTFSEEFNDGKGHDIQAIYGTNPGDTIEITTDLDNVYNIRIINEYKEELNNYNSKPQKSEQDKIELEKAYNKLVSKLNMQAKINGRVVSTMKGLNKTVQDRESDNVYVSLRNNIFSNPEQFNAILTGSGEYAVRITNNAGEFIKPNITVSQVLMGHPNYNYTETEEGVLATEFKPLSDVEAKAIVDIGYVVGTKTFTRDNQTVNTMFLKKMMNKKSTNKIPFVVLNVGGKRVAYPAKVNSFGEAEVSEFENVYNNKSADPVTKANALNRILAKNGIDIKIPGNSFIGFFDNNINDSFFQEKLAQLKNVNYFYNVEDWLDLNIDLNDIVKSQISLDINVLNPFHSPKLSFSYDALDMKDFVPPKKGKIKKKAASKSKNVEVNLADLFNKKNCQ